jgi:hypothetical protein
MTTFGEKVLKKIDAIANRSTEKYRLSLNKNLHALDVNYESLLNSIPENYPETQFVEDYDHFITILRGGLKPANSLGATIKFIKGRDKPGVFLVEDPQFGKFVVGVSYSTVQTAVSKLMRAQKNTSYFTRFDVLNKTLNNVGHAPTESVGAIGQSPLKLKLLDMLRILPENPQVIASLDRLHNAHAFSTTYSMERPNIDLSKLNKALGRVTVLVTIQSFEKNNALAKLEAEIERDISKYFKTAEFRNDLLNAKGSNSIKEDILELLKQEVLGKRQGVPKHTKKPSQSNNKKLDFSSNIGPITTPKKLPRLRAVQDNRVISLVTIQQLINGKLRDQIQNNMGKGNARTILNYRSGRFADSVRVTKLARTKDDEVTAFYTYMKYPYQTFEPGFKQGQIVTRDPKLLISKSIRDIARDIVTARLKAVLV